MRAARSALRKLGAFPQFLPTCPGSRLAQVGIFSALFCASWGASPKNPVFAKTAILAKLAQVGKKSALLPVLLAQIGKNCGKSAENGFGIQHSGFRGEGGGALERRGGEDQVWKIKDRVRETDQMQTRRVAIANVPPDRRPTFFRPMPPSASLPKSQASSPKPPRNGQHALPCLAVIC
jgi:hypothetical protein